MPQLSRCASVSRCLRLLPSLAMAGLVVASATPAAAAADGRRDRQVIPQQAVPRTSQPLHQVDLPTPATLPTASQPDDAVASTFDDDQTTDDLAAAALSTSCLSPSIDQKVLVVAAIGQEPELGAITSSMDYLGVPYTVYAAASTLGGLTDTMLASGCHAFYSGLITTTGDLGYNNNGVWQSALSADEWQTLWSYAALFKIRQVSWYTYPTTLYGFQAFTGSGLSTDTTPLPLSLTAGGKQVWSYVNPSARIPVQNAWAYPAQALDASTVPLLVDASGNLLAASHLNADGRETLAVTVDSNQYMLHDLVLNYGLINWVTGGLFLGERHIFATPQIDDLYLDNSVWQTSTPCGTAPDDPSLPIYRNSGADFLNVLAWQTGAQLSNRQYAAFRLAFAFNGYGTTSTYFNSFTPALRDNGLTLAVQLTNPAFHFVTHTWDHTNLDNVTYDVAKSEIQQDVTFATKARLLNFSKLSLVTPDVSGLTNTAAMQAAYDTGVRYTVTNTSLPGWSNPTPNTGVPITGSYGASSYTILGIPRHPVNLYFNVTTPEQWVAEDTCLYPSGAIGNIGGSYAGLLDRVSGNAAFVGLLQYMLSGDMDPWMFHIANLTPYGGSHKFLLSDLLEATAAKYQGYFTLPVLSPTEDDLGKRMAARAAYNAAGVRATRTGNTLTVTAQRATTVPVTGLTIAGSELYGGQHIAHFTLAPGQTVTYTIK